MDYATLSNLIYFLMFRDNTDEATRKAVIEATLDNDDVLPIVHYKASKYSKFYLKHRFPNMDVEEYLDKFYYAERYFNQAQMDNLYNTDLKYAEMKAFLN